MACDFWTKLVKATCGEPEPPPVEPSWLGYGAQLQNTIHPLLTFESKPNPANSDIHDDIIANVEDYIFVVDGHTLTSFAGFGEAVAVVGDWEYKVNASVSPAFRLTIQHESGDNIQPPTDNLTLEIWKDGELLDKSNFKRTSTTAATGQITYDDMEITASNGGAFLGINPVLPNRGDTAIPVIITLVDNR